QTITYSLQDEEVIIDRILCAAFGGARLCPAYGPGASGLQQYAGDRSAAQHHAEERFPYPVREERADIYPGLSEPHERTDGDAELYPNAQVPQGGQGRRAGTDAQHSGGEPDGAVLRRPRPSGPDGRADGQPDI